MPEPEYTRREFFSYSGQKALEIARAALEALREARGKKDEKKFLGETKKEWARPPGALEEKSFLEKCTRCGECLKACPPLVLRALGPEWGENLEGTPSLWPRERACLMCEDFPCVASCPEGALSREPNQIPRLGLAVVDENRCVLKDHQPCRECEKACPKEFQSVFVDLTVKRVFIDVKTCVGCGLCAEICPAQAIGIKIVK